MGIEQFVLDDLSSNDPFTWKVDLTDQGITDDDIIRLADALEGNDVCQVLNLSGNAITSRGLSELLIAAASVRSLREIDLSGNPSLGDPAARAVEGLLMATSSIAYLNLSECGLTRRGRSAVSEAAERYTAKVGMMELELDNASFSGSALGAAGASAAASFSGAGDAAAPALGSASFSGPVGVPDGSRAGSYGSGGGEDDGGGDAAPVAAKAHESVGSAMGPRGSSRDLGAQFRTSSRLPSPAVRGFATSGAKLSLRGVGTSSGNLSNLSSPKVTPSDSDADSIAARERLMSQRFGASNVRSSSSGSLVNDPGADDDDEAAMDRAASKGPAPETGFTPYRRIEAEDLQVGSKIASGGFARVYRGTWRGQDVAIKIFKKGKEEATRIAFEKEMHILGCLRHPQIVQMLGAYTDDEGRLAIVTELMRGGSLFDLLRTHHKAGTRLPLAKAKQILRDIAEGCAYLHGTRPRVIHRDLKSLNILLSDHERAKVADFGLSREFIDGETMTVGIGTPHWLPYEIFDRQKYDHKLDVYSYAMMVWEVVTTEVPFHGMDAFTLIGNMLKNKNLRPEIPPDCPPQLATIMKKCWHANPKKRPEFTEIIAMLDAIDA